MRGILLLAIASMGFGSAITLVLTKPPILLAAAKFIMGLFAGALHAL